MSTAVVYAYLAALMMEGTFPERRLEMWISIVKFIVLSLSSVF